MLKSQAEIKEKQEGQLHIFYLLLLFQE